jgi:hypothetical protein
MKKRWERKVKCGKKMLRRNDTLKKENVNGSGLVGSTIGKPVPRNDYHKLELSKA